MTLLNSINSNVLSKSHGQPCHSGLAQRKAVQQQLQQTLENDPFQDITLSDVEDAAPMTTLLEDSDTEIEVD